MNVVGLAPQSYIITLNGGQEFTFAEKELKNLSVKVTADGRMEFEQ